MVSTYTPNIGLNEPARGDDVGTWDTAVNGNSGVIDGCIGGIATISLNNSNVVLNAAQLQSRMIVFNSTLTGSVTITFATSFIKDYMIRNSCTGSSAFTITLETTAGGQVICPPPGETTSIYNDGTNVFFTDLDHIGSYWDYAGSSVPNWVSGCSPQQPYLNCIGGTFSSATYPVLTMILGGTTLPDSRSAARVALDQSAGLLSSGTTGFSPNTVGAKGGSQSVTLSSANLPKLIDPTHTHTTNEAIVGSQTGFAGNGSGSAANINGTTSINYAATGITYGSSTVAAVALIQPTYMGGITMIRAA